MAVANIYDGNMKHRARQEHRTSTNGWSTLCISLEIFGRLCEAISCYPFQIPSEVRMQYTNCSMMENHQNSTSACGRFLVNLVVIGVNSRASRIKVSKQIMLVRNREICASLKSSHAQVTIAIWKLFDDEKLKTT